jgi:hypothetical protein
MDNFSELGFQQNRTMSVRISQFLRATVVVLLMGGVMYAAALVARTQHSIAPAAPLSSQQ